MTSYFCDSSALVKRYAREQGTGWMISLFRRMAGNVFYAARITRVEVIAALVRKERGALLTPHELRRAIVRVRRDFTKRMVVIEATPALLEHAERFAEIYGLRGYDAVQFAAAIEANAGRAHLGLPPLTLITGDKELLQAAMAEGLATDNPETH